MNSYEKRIKEAEKIARKWPGSEIVVSNIPVQYIPKGYTQYGDTRRHKFVVCHEKLAVSAVVLNTIPF